MHPSLKISTINLDPADYLPQKIDMTGQYAFAICTKGEFDIKILNEHYEVKPNCIFACMPFVDIEVTQISEPCEVIMGYIHIEDLPAMINRWVNTNNLSAIQSHPLVRITDQQCSQLISSINAYLNDCDIYEKVSSRIQHDIIDLQSRLLVAQVLNIYFININIKGCGYVQRDIVFQRFMLTLYGNFREHRNVHFYAVRSGVSLKYFSTIIRQLSGASPSEWIERVVIGEAKSMLSDIGRSIKDIAASLNFPDAPTFTKYFQRVTGMTPKAYRKTVYKIGEI